MQMIIMTKRRSTIRRLPVRSSIELPPSTSSNPKHDDDNDSSTISSIIIKKTKMIIINMATTHYNHRKTLLFLSLCLYIVIKMYKSEFVVEMFFSDIFLKAKLFMTIRYIQVRYLQSKPRSPLKIFTMNKNNAFVLNLDSDTERMQHFWNMNVNATIPIQRYLAYAWQKPPFPNKSLQKRKSSQQQGNDDNDEERISPQVQALLDEQTSWAKQYPWLASPRARNGEKGCSLSHIRILHDFVLEYQNYYNNSTAITANDTNAYSNSSNTRSNKSEEDDPDDWYRFIFEDDAKLMEPLLSQGYVMAPADADVVFLSRGVTRAVKVPYDYRPKDDDETNHLAPMSSLSSRYHQLDYSSSYAVRVITGYGTQGYVITLRGAKKFLHCLSTYSQPVDIVLLSSCSSVLRIYLPELTVASTTSTTSTTSTSSSSWLSLYKPQVMHDNRHSTITTHS